MNGENPTPVPDPFEKAAVLDAHSLRGLAHPLRLRVYQFLQAAPATGKKVSIELGISSASASYHLRQLETYGFIEEDPALGTARERWWRVLHKGFRMPEHLDTEVPELSTALRHALAARWSERMAAAVDLWASQPEGWREAQFMADRVLHLNLEQMERLRAELSETLARYAHEGDPEGRAVNVQLTAFPFPETDREPFGDTEAPPGAEKGAP